MSHELRRRLEEAARRMKCGKNSIVTRALEEYLEKNSRVRFLEEARKQSLLASATSTDDDIWLEQGDTSAWK
jgi:ribosomal protein L10